MALVTCVEGISEYRLANKVQLLLFPDDSRPEFTLSVTVLVGSRHEGYGESGMAHLLEHMVFKGTDSYPKIPEALKNHSVLRFNGTTSKDRTNYYETLPSSDDNLEFAIRMEADRLLNSWIRGSDLASEMTVVRNEFEQGENNPPGILLQRMASAAYNWHNYGKAIIGNRKDIENVPVSRLQEFYKQHYQSDNIMVVLSGKYDEEKALAWITEHFGSLPIPDRVLADTYTEEPVQDGEREVILRRSGGSTLVGACYHVPSVTSKEFVAVEVLAMILCMKPCGIIYKAMVETGFASSVVCNASPSRDPGLLNIICELPKGADAFACKEKLLSLIENIGKMDLDSEIINRAAQIILKREERSLTNSYSFAISLSNWRAYGDWRLYFLHRDQLSNVSVADVQSVTKKYLLSSNRTTGLYIPTDTPLRTPELSYQVVNELREYVGRENIAMGEVFDPSPEIIDSRTKCGILSSGLSYSLLSKKTRGERVYVIGKIRYGNEESLFDLSTESVLLPPLMERGTQKHTYQQLSDRLSELDAVMSLSGEQGSLSFGFQTSRTNFASMMSLLTEILREPLLKDEELDVIRLEYITRLESAATKPTAMAQRELQRRLFPYGKDSIHYNLTFEEEIEKLKACSIDNIKRIHKELLSGQHGEVCVIGDFNEGEAISLLEDMVIEWKGSEYAYVECSVLEAWKELEKCKQIETPDKANSIFICGIPLVMKDDDRDYEALLIGNFILGGGSLSSRLMDSIRTDQGLSYAVGSNFKAEAKDFISTFLMYAICNPANTNKVISSMNEELKKLLEFGPTDEEVTIAVDSFLKRREGQRAKEMDMASILLKNLSVDRTMEHYARSDEKLRSLTPKMIQEAMVKHLDPSSFLKIAVGDFKTSVFEQL